MRFDSEPRLFGGATHVEREARQGRPSYGQMLEYLGALADTFGLPAGLVHAVAQTESNFDTDHRRAKRVPSRDVIGPENTGYGVMQVRDDQIGQTVPDPDGSAYKIGHNIKNDWRANARAGVALLAQQYQLATLENPFGSEREHAQQAYAGYSGDAPYRDRYLQRLSHSDQPAHPDDRAFLKNFLHARHHREQQDQNQPEGVHELLYRYSDAAGHAEKMPFRVDSRAAAGVEDNDGGSPYLLFSRQQETKSKQEAQANSIHGRNRNQGHNQKELSARDRAYLDKYYEAVSAQAKYYNVDPSLVLGVGIESAFASEGTYHRTGDAFGMTGGSTKNMTTARSPSENVKQFFDNWGNQIRGTGKNAAAFLNALQGRDASGRHVKGWKTYNNVNPEWKSFINGGINEMRRDTPIYLSRRNANPYI